MEDEDDDLHAAFHEEVVGPAFAADADAADAAHETASSPLLAIHPMEDDAHGMDGLQPGGVGSGIKEVVIPDTAAKGSVLDSMTLKELRRLAEQKGISGSRTMRKPELIDAIRAQPVVNPFEAAAALEHASSVSPFEAAEGSDDIISAM
jgi:orotate phosphoribosyltransferase